MSKNHVMHRFADEPRPSGSSRSKVAAAILVGVVLTPLVVEFATLYYAKWNAIMGRPTNATNTPIIDWIHATLTAGYAEVVQSDSHVFGKIADSPKIPLLIAGCVLTLAMYCLKRSHQAK